VLERFGEAAIGNNCIDRAEREKTDPDRIEVEDPARVGQREKEKHPSYIDPGHHYFGGEVTEELLLGHGICGPEQGGDYNNDQPDREIIRPGEDIHNPVVEEEDEPADENDQPDPLNRTEPFPEDNNPPQQQQHR